MGGCFSRKNSNNSHDIIVSHVPSSPYFTDYSWEKGLFYAASVLYVVVAMVIVTLEPFISSSCSSSSNAETTTSSKPLEFENALFVYDPCRYVRLPVLLFLTRQECMFGRRLVAAVVLGGIIGWERRQADRPAGIRTMALVSLGSCLFSICSAFAFMSGPMSWDASRVSAAIPSGVGFLGSALIFKNAKSDSSAVGHTVQGLTTATSVWLSAAVGIASGGGLYFAASFCVAIMLVILRFGPRWKAPKDDDSRCALDDIKTDYDTSTSNDPEYQPLAGKKASKKMKKRVLKTRPSLVD